MTDRQALELLRKEDEHLVVLSHAIAVLGWDFETGSPEKASDERAEQMTLLSMMQHEEIVGDKISSLLDSIGDESDFSLAERALAREWRRTVSREKAIPASLVERMSLLEAKGHVRWLEAREKNDFAIFLPVLSEIVDAQKEMAALIAPGRKPYDALLDLYEPEMTMADIDPLFDRLEVEIHAIMDRIEERSAAVDDGFLKAPYDEQALHGFCMGLVDRMGFDRTRGAVGISAHPFTTTLGRDDVRITTRYTDASLFDPIGSVMHETGHALYEQNASLNPEIRGTSLADGASMGIHESQSRFWENFIGRSEAFWKGQYPALKEAIPSLEDIPLVNFLRAVNRSCPSAIRVNADELTYSLHIILRYRIEKALFDGSLSVSDIPEAWNRMSGSIVRYVPKNDSEGCLQDVHWSQGSFGYFPTYALGNIYAAMFHEKLCSDLGGREEFDRCLISGDFARIASWQKKKIWYNGKVHMPKDLLSMVTGKAPTLDPYIRYLNDKFDKMFD